MSGIRGWAVIGAAIVLILGAFSQAAAEKGIHGADSVFQGEGITLVWAILKGADEESSWVQVRMLYQEADSGPLRFYGVEGIDPFTGSREIYDKAVPLQAEQTVRFVRSSFREKTGRRFLFYAAADEVERGRPVLVIFYQGVPDTAPEVLTEKEMEAYFETALSRLKPH
jgi:hypothetical protein